MKILVIYNQIKSTGRNTVDEHLYSFRHYSNGECFYLNAAYGIPGYLLKIKFDMVVYHYTFTGLKWGGEEKFFKKLKEYKLLKKITGYKIAIPQDEYVNSNAICTFFKEFGVKTVFTCFTEKDWEKVYPKEKSGLDYYFTAFPGYVDEFSIERIQKYIKNHKERTIDIGYRARKVPYWLGRHGLKKWQITDEFLKILKDYNLKYDLSNNDQKIFKFDEWYSFLSNCRVVLGCEGGASLHDPDGSIRKKVDNYMSGNPWAEFKEVEENCFQGMDNNIELFALSPRHFEACMTKTCQALVEGEYAGIFKPGVHYIEIKKDWSNIRDVIEKIKDVKYCDQIAENAYCDIIESGLHTYREFVKKIINHVENKNTLPENIKVDLHEKILESLLLFRENHNFLCTPIRFLKYKFENLISLVIKKIFNKNY